ncbi:Uncharacterised protein [uncultured archaeon]|nr:Uncharacterised protein [uncultured archaeon]
MQLPDAMTSISLRSIAIFQATQAKNQILYPLVNDLESLDYRSGFRPFAFLPSITSSLTLWPPLCPISS